MSISSTIRSHAVLATTVTVLIVVIAVLAGRKAAEKPVTDVKPAMARVTLVNAATFRTDSVTVSANGTVESHSQADLKSQTSAPIAVIHVAIGDPVAQGQIILELQNADIRAQLAQAEAQLAIAQGRVAVLELHRAVAQRLDLGALQDDPALELVEEVVAKRRLPVGGDVPRSCLALLALGHAATIDGDRPVKGCEAPEGASQVLA